MQYMYLPSPRRLDVCFILRRCEEGRVAGGLGLDCRQGGKPHGKHIEFVDVVTFDVGTLGGSGGGGGGLFVAGVSMLLIEDGPDDGILGGDLGLEDVPAEQMFDAAGGHVVGRRGIDVDVLAHLGDGLANVASVGLEVVVGVPEDGNVLVV